jgi:RNA polymerase sigma-70 factor (ECF subfamily)
LKTQGNPNDEQRLIAAAQADPAQFSELYERNFNRVYAYVAHRVHDRHEAEDLTAEVFHEALRNLGRFEWRGAPFAAWLFRIAAALIADRWRSSARRHEVAVDDLDEHEPAGASEVVENRAALYKLVDSLPEEQRLVLVRRFVEQRSIREIAHELGRSEGAIKQLQFRAIQTLRSHATPSKVRRENVRMSHEQPERI